MTEIAPGDIVVYEVSLNEHPLVVGGDDDRPDEELVEAVEGRTETADDIDWPEWAVFESGPPDMERIRYVNTSSRINVRASQDHDAHQKQRDVFDEIVDRVDIDGFSIDDADMSYWPTTHEDDFENPIHLDLVD